MAHNLPLGQGKEDRRRNVAELNNQQSPWRFGGGSGVPTTSLALNGTARAAGQVVLPRTGKKTADAIRARAEMPLAALCKCK